MSDQVSAHDFPGHEPSAWMREAITARLGQGGIPELLGIVTFNLTDAEEGTHEDRTCDRCRTYVPPGTTFYTGIHEQNPAGLAWPWNRVLAGRQILVAFGLCRACADLEVGATALGGDGR